MDKIKISKKLYDKLVEWKVEYELSNYEIMGALLNGMPDIVDDWYRNDNLNVKQCNNRLIAIIRWVNGEDVFEIEKPKK